MSPSRFLITGYGIVGPVLALLFKNKSYPPIILEKVRSLGDTGIWLMLIPKLRSIPPFSS
jgi:2-polyprenyl-6-methoxyphenol hydroxylase-like FAD-dependent oxidoreductase